MVPTKVLLPTKIILSDLLSDVLPKYTDYRSQTLYNKEMSIKTRSLSKVDMLVFHSADEDNWSPERLSRFFIEERKFPTCGYHYYIMEDKIYHMVDENLITYHASMYNSNSVGFSIAYSPDIAKRFNQVLNPVLYQNAVDTAAFLCIKLGIEPTTTWLVGHRELWGTGWINKDKQGHPNLRKTCPGLDILLNTFRYDVVRKIQEIMNLFKIPTTVDGIYGPQSRENLKSIIIV